VSHPLDDEDDPFMDHSDGETAAIFDESFVAPPAEVPVEVPSANGQCEGVEASRRRHVYKSLVSQTCVQLQQVCRRKGLPTSGEKLMLVNRILKHIGYQ